MGYASFPGLAPQRLMADGYGFAGEGDWKTAALVRAMKVMGEGLKGGTSFMEDYTYHLGAGRAIRCSARTCLKSARSIAAGKPSLEIHPLVDRRQGGSGSPRLRRAGGAGAQREPDRPRRPLPPPGQRGDAVEHPALPKLPVARAVWECKPDFKTACGAWILAGGAHHTGFSYAVTDGDARGFRRRSRASSWSDRSGDHALARFKQDLRRNDVYYYLAQGFRA